MTVIIDKATSKSNEMCVYQATMQALTKFFFQPTRAQLSLRKSNPNSSLVLSSVIVLVVDPPQSPAT
jgi:hypothetical protein